MPLGVAAEHQHELIGARLLRRLAGAPIRGRVTEVVSGSKRIGGTPTLAMNFDGIELEDGKTELGLRRLAEI